MFNKTKVSLIVAFFVLIFCFLPVFRSEQVTLNIVKAQTESARLSLELSNSQESHLQAEPISFNLKLSNQTNQPISWRGFLRGGPSLNFLTTNATGVTTRFNASEFATGYYYSSLRVMQPGEQEVQTSLIEMSLLEQLFPSPGLYTFQVEFVYDRGVTSEPRTKILSNPIPVSIIEPQGTNRQAYQYIKDKLNFTNNRTDNRVKARLVQEFADRFRDTFYAKYIIFNLGNLYQAMGEDAKAFRELCKISDENFHYSKEVKKQVFLLHAKLNPVVLSPLPDNAPEPVVIHPCRRILPN